MEVIYTGLHWTPEMIVNAALQENVDAIGVSILSGAHMTIFPKLLGILKDKGLGQILLFGGGVIPPDDIKELKRMGVDALFPPGSSIREIAEYLNKALQASV
jgi:methylmalonyl-CoA mutase C-terminal domain/subunit